MVGSKAGRCRRLARKKEAQREDPQKETEAPRKKADQTAAGIEISPSIDQTVLEVRAIRQSKLARAAGGANVGEKLVGGRLVVGEGGHVNAVL